MLANFYTNLSCSTTANSSLCLNVPTVPSCTHLIIFMVDESQLELVFRRVDAENAWSAFSVETVDVVTLDAGYVDGQV